VTARRIVTTAPGTHSAAFGLTEWGLLAAVSLMWGASFVFIEEGLEAFQPGLVALGRLLCGAITLSLFPAARRPVDRAELPAIAVLGVTWMAVPLILFPVAQQWINSSLAGMLNGAVPLFTAGFAIVFLGRLPGGRLAWGLFVGFVGVLAVALPGGGEDESTAVGIILVLAATALYGLSSNLAVPLQQRNGALPILLRAQLVALVVVAPYGLVSVPGSSWSWSSAGAIMALGALGTAFAFVAMATLLGRVGATRASITIYFIPLVAVVLGVVLRDETVSRVSLGGVVLVLAGAALASRRE